MNNKIETKELFDVLKTIAGRKNRFADIYISGSKSLSITLEDNKVELINDGQDNGIGLRLSEGDKIAYAYSNIINKSNLDILADEVHAIFGNGESLAIDVPEEININGTIKINPQDIDIKDKIAILEQCNSAARDAGKEIIQVSVSYFDSTKKIRLVNSLADAVKQTRGYVRLIVQVVAMRDGIIQTAFEAPGFQGGFEIFQHVSPAEIGRAAAERAIRMLDADPAPSGQMPVIIDHGSGGVIFHEAIGHGLEADEVSKHSVYKEKLGQVVATEHVTVIDDPTIDNLWGSYAYDDEGSPSQKTVLIENGKLVNYLCDRLNGQKIGMRSTGNSRRENYAHPPIPRMSNTYLKPGEMSKEDIISQTDYGLYAKKLGGGQVDPQSGDFVFSVAEGYMIKNGKIDTPVRGATLVGNGPKVLFNIDKVANDLDFDPGTCGKDGQGAPVTTGQPTIRVLDLTVGGTEVG